jgi:threonine dehydrogenase-like Zn-dependent dehydrogenase
MKATVMYGAHDVRVETVPDARLIEPTDALVRVTRACICGSDLWPYNSMIPRTFGATAVVSERGDAAIERVRELTGGRGAHSVLECVGHGEAMRTAVSITRAGGAVGRVGVPQDATIPNAQPTFYANITIAGGPAPVRAYVEELLPDVLEGRIEPGRVFDRITNIDGVPAGYRAMNARESIKVMIKF